VEVVSWLNSSEADNRVVKTLNDRDSWISSRFPLAGRKIVAKLQVKEYRYYNFLPENADYKALNSAVVCNAKIWSHGM